MRSVLLLASVSPLPVTAYAPTSERANDAVPLKSDGISQHPVVTNIITELRAPTGGLPSATINGDSGKWGHFRKFLGLCCALDLEAEWQEVTRHALDTCVKLAAELHRKYQDAAIFTDVHAKLQTWGELSYSSAKLSPTHTR